MRLKQHIGLRLMLGIFLAGVSAGSLGQLLYWRLGGSGDIERHQAMSSHARGDQIGFESKTRLKREPCGANRAIGQQFEAFPLMLNGTLLQTNMNDAVGQILWANHREYRPFVFQQIADSNLNLSVRVAQRHMFWNGPAYPCKSKRPFTDARAGLTRTRSAISLSLHGRVIAHRVFLRHVALQLPRTVNEVLPTHRLRWNELEVFAWLPLIVDSVEPEQSAISIDRNQHAQVGNRSILIEARLDKSVHAATLSHLPRSGISEPSSQANGGLSTIEEIL